MTNKTLAIEATKPLDLTELSDAFRRHAKFTQHDVAKKLVRESLQFVNMLSYYYPEYQDDEVNNPLIARNLRNQLTDIANLAASTGVKRVILPVNGDRRDSYGAFLRRMVLDQDKLPVKFSLQYRPYRADLQALGKPDHRFKTVLAETCRGFLNIAPELKLKL